MWSPLMHPLLGSWPATQACALTESRTWNNPLVPSLVLNPPHQPGHLSFLKNYILLIMLLELSQFFPLCPLPPSIPHSLRPSPHRCPCPCVRRISSLATPFPILYFTSPWLLCNYLFVLLNPHTSSPIPLHPFPPGNHQNALHIYDSVSVLLVA